MRPSLCRVVSDILEVRMSCSRPATSPAFRSGLLRTQAELILASYATPPSSRISYPPEARHAKVTDGIKASLRATICEAFDIAKQNRKRVGALSRRGAGEQHARNDGEHWASFGVLKHRDSNHTVRSPGTNVTGAIELRPRRGERRREIERVTELCLCCPGAPSL